ncbi:ABC transporter permease [Microbacterium sp. SA39]|uniref:ABC transporter permease n=1 Tax=Microbacterium sp. SA39 TaxID=1263625 RepID=UPI00061E3813|nr:ABC transporter permease [Microbacterium sp. SA39]KJQ52755.1 Glutathione transport system permease protein GsiC [Microbacterium sp. SA39]
MFRRILGALGVLVIASFLSFSLISLAPGDLAQSVAKQRTGSVGSPELVEQIREEYGLNDPFFEQYWRWVSGAVRGDLGRSIETNVPIAQDVGERALTTLTLTGGALGFGIILGVSLALIAAMRPGGAIDRILRFVGLFAVSIPAFALALILILYFSLQLGVLPVSGTDDGFKSWVLPCLVLGLAPAGAISRVLRTALGDEMRQAYVTTAFSRGYSLPRVVLREALPATLTGLLAVIGVQFGLVFINTVVIEAIFGLTGLGQYFAHAAQFRDVPVVQSSLFLFALVFVVQSLIVDGLQALVDPRVRRESSTV